MATTTPNYDINYDDERFQAVDEKWDGLSNDMSNAYQGMIDQTDKFYQDQINASNQWADKQQQLQQEQTDFTIEQIEQQKEQAHKDYLKEQSGAYQDWQKQSSQHGVNAEQMASQGMLGTGFSESSQVSMYNTYQNRVATSREVYNRAVLNYDNNIKEARLQNNAILAEIAYEALQTQLELSLQGFQYKNSLITEQMNKKVELEQMRSNEWYKVLDQMNTENQFAESIRQYEQNFAEDVRQFEETQRFQAEENQKDRDFQAAQAELERAHDEKILEIQHDYDKKLAKVEQDYKLAYLKAQTVEEKNLIQEQYSKDMMKLEKQHEYDIELADKELADKKAYLKYQYELEEEYNGDDEDGDGDGDNAPITKSPTSPKTTNQKTNIERISSESENNQPTIDEASVKALGITSASQLWDYVKQGKVVLKTKNGKAYAEWSSAWKTAQNTVKSKTGTTHKNTVNMFK